MKSVLFAAAATLVLPLPAAAQSLHDTHELVWHPSGKTPAAIYRERKTAACKAVSGHHQAGKAPLPAGKRCAADVAKAPAALDGGEVAAAR
ncbi:MAG TPA: hypothetical protein VF409_03665 [Sphingomonas sp.]